MLQNNNKLNKPSTRTTPNMVRLVFESKSLRPTFSVLVIDDNNNITEQFTDRELGSIAYYNMERLATHKVKVQYSLYDL